VLEGPSHSADDRNDKSFKPALNGIQADLHRALGAILAQSEQRAPGFHGSCSTVIGETQTMAHMRQPNPLGYKQLDTLAVQLAGSVPE
jgi:hypothetical protein